MADTAVAEKVEKVEAVEVKKYSWPFLVGADPEFTVVSGTRPMNAEDIFRTFFKGLKEKKRESGRGGIEGYVLPGGNIGWDNHPATGELRPDPGTPEQVVANLKSLFLEAHTRMPFVDLTTLTIAAAAGGHIHLSMPEELNRDFENKTKKWAAIERTVGMFIILIMMGENNLSRELRKRVNGANYGELLDFRVEPKFQHPSGAHGYTLEVRGPTAEWITSEKIALGTLAYMAIAWDSILKGNLKAIAPIMFENRLKANQMVGPLMDNYCSIQKAYLDRMRPFIRSHEAYPEYKNALELILNPQRVIEEKKKMHFCINEGWGFTSTSKSIPTNKFMDEDKIEEATSKFPEQILRNLSQFAWNEDVHVEQFATALSKRCVALGWKPKHEYYLFGLKKGMDAIIMRDEEGNFITGNEIIKNKEDYKVVDHKFNRLGKKAEPVYGRVIHPRTGEIAKEKDNKRVMIGIPYGMRQKNDVKPLMRLVLRFEKNPKAYSAIDPSALPEGESSLKAAMLKDEELEKGFSEASRRGEPAASLPMEMVEAIQEVERDLANEVEGVISRDTIDIIISKLDQLHSRWSSQFSMTREGAIDAVQRWIGRNNDWPEINDASTKGTVIGDLVDMLLETEDGADDELVINAHKHAAAYLLMAGMNQQGGVSVEDRSHMLTHHIRMQQGNPNAFGSSAIFEMRTENRSNRDARSRTIAPILDALGISSMGSRGAIETFLREHPGTWIRVDMDPVAMSNGADPYAVINDGRIVINPDRRLPHVWIA